MLTVPEGAACRGEVRIQFPRQAEKLTIEASILGCEAEGLEGGAPAQSGSWKVGDRLMSHVWLLGGCWGLTFSSRWKSERQAKAPGLTAASLPLHNHVSRGES